ncbi:hypothetical protein LAZ67_3001692 [Cordylochernes scorpioides]|uniref:Uncharacterized protein n=1 Tax=Cordylochernes scorpioides TaxID=51811 RepID=A0ABY6K8V4_9ARAC|nr:hypothetical protein LAZ67_3001692 [Cordylochernes scorpioides]
MVQWWLRPRPSKKIGQYLSIDQGYRTSGLIPTDAEWKMDRISGDGEQDECFFYGGNSTGWQLAVGCSRGSATVALRIPSGRVFILPTYPDVRQHGLLPSLKLICISPFRKWRLSYNGWLRFTPNALLYNVPLDSTPEMVADCLSLQTLSSPKSQSLRMMESMERYEQPGMFLGTVDLGGEPEEVSLWGLRIRDLTHLDPDQLKGMVNCLCMFPDEPPKKIKILKEYLDENLMTLNESKSKIMVFRNGDKPSNKDKWFWNDKTITITSRYTYLGFPLTPTIYLFMLMR